MTDEMEVQIYVYLLDEGVDVWRPIQARCVGESQYRILSRNVSPEDEHWEFSTGDVVRCVSKAFDDGEALVAVERLAPGVDVPPSSA